MVSYKSEDFERIKLLNPSLNYLLNQWLANNSQEFEHTLHHQKENERYIFRYNKEDKSEVSRHVGIFASRPELSFTWTDAAILSRKISESAEKERLEKINHRFYSA